MEESLGPSAQYKITSLSIDSRFADQNYGSPLDTTDFMIRLPETIKNVMRIRLSSTEIPAMEYTFTNAKGNTSFSVTDSVSTRPFTITDGNYPLPELRGLITTFLSGSTPVYTVSTSQNRLTISRTSTTQQPNFTLSVGSSDPQICSRKTHWGLGYYLGYRVPYINGSRTISSIDTQTTNAGVTTYTSVITAYTAPILIPNNYYLMQLLCPDPLETFLHRIDGNSAIPAFAKIILRNTMYGTLGASSATITTNATAAYGSTTYGMLYDDNSNMVRKEHTFLAPTNISQLRVRLLDPFGVPVILNTMDWSLTFEVTEIVNTKKYDQLNKTYAN
jgi:hypothetical protein